MKNTPLTKDIFDKSLKDAALRGDYEAVDLLMNDPSHAADVNTLNHILLGATFHDHHQITDLILTKRKDDILEANPDFLTTLANTSLDVGTPASMKILLKHGLNPNDPKITPNPEFLFVYPNHTTATPSKSALYHVATQAASTPNQAQDFESLLTAMVQSGANFGALNDFEKEYVAARLENEAVSFLQPKISDHDCKLLNRGFASRILGTPRWGDNLDHIRNDERAADLNQLRTYVIDDFSERKIDQKNPKSPAEIADIVIVDWALNPQKPKELLSSIMAMNRPETQMVFDLTSPHLFGCKGLNDEQNSVVTQSIIDLFRSKEGFAKHSNRLEQELKAEKNKQPSTSTKPKTSNPLEQTQQTNIRQKT